MLGQIGPYRLLRKLGEGGMGVVYAAHDERLDRSVAIKTIRESCDDTARERFFREARAAASVSHPNVCQLFDIGELEGNPYLVMELLEGEPLTDRLGRGALPLTEAARICLGILTALESLHGRGFIHRDLKPSNVFLTSHGVKLLDFGLARSFQPELTPESPTLKVGGARPITVTGMIVGTPRYMAPEQLLGATVGPSADVFAAGALLFEMVAGRPAFEGDNPMKLFHDIVYERPPTLGGSAAIAAVNRIVQRALAKSTGDRYHSAAAMSQDVREILMISDAGSPVTARTVTRIIVLPFRPLRPDAEYDFLAEALPEAVTAALTGLGSLIVRSPMTAQRFAKGDLDLAAIAHAADVDVVLTGTVLRAGDQLRVTTQLLEVPNGTVIWSLSSQGSLNDIFDFQDRITRRIVESLELPLGEREQRMLKGELPANARAHEYYLRAMQQGHRPDDWLIARDLYLQALDEDPRYAPALARLARLYILMAKYGGNPAENFAHAENALRRALEVNPDLPIAHHVYANLEVHLGRARDAMLRLLDRVQRGTNEAEVFAGLVTAFRFCGLLQESAAAHETARQLEPAISTSAAHTFWMMGEYQRALDTVDAARDFTGDEAFILDSMGRTEEASRKFGERLAAMGDSGSAPALLGRRILTAFWRAFERKKEAITVFEQDLADFPDPEGLYYQARAYARLEEWDGAIKLLERTVDRGFHCYQIMLRDPWLDPLRARAGFNAIVRRAEERHREAAAAFAAHPASRLLAVGAR